LKRSNRMMIVAGILLAAVAFAAVLLLGSGGTAPPPPEMITVIVASRDVPLGTQLAEDMVTTSERPVEQAAGSFQTAGEVTGRVLRRPVANGEVLRETDFETDDANVEITGSISAGLRAIAVPLDKVTSVGYLVRPGDFVDVLLAVRDGDGLNPVVGPAPDESPEPLASPVPNESPDPFAEDGTTTYIAWDGLLNNTTVKVVVQNVQVLAMLRPSSAVDPDAPAPADEPVIVAILAVSPQDAELVRFAQLDGNLSLLLRSPEDRQAEPAGTTGVTLRRLVDEFGVLPPGPVTSQPIQPQQPLP
jgi:Flp pilus assembly protein CpaB